MTPLPKILEEARLEAILARIPGLTLGVFGDLFLDRYLEIDASLTEPSIETGLDAFQVVSVRSTPGAAGTVVNNLVALGVGRVCILSVIGDDGEGYELQQALDSLRGVERTDVHVATSRRFRTPTYTKPMLNRIGEPARELNRLDIKNRDRLAAATEEKLLHELPRFLEKVDALVVLDQVSEPDCGVVTARVRRLLAELGVAHPDKMILADSRECIGDFHSLWLKPNETECGKAIQALASTDPMHNALELARRTQRPVFCTRGGQGILLVDPRRSPIEPKLIPAVPVDGPIDIVGAGDSTSAALVSAVAAGASLEEAAVFGILTASITIQQLGTTGTASPEQLRRRWHEVGA